MIDHILQLLLPNRGLPVEWGEGRGEMGGRILRCGGGGVIGAILSRGGAWYLMVRLVIALTFLSSRTTTVNHDTDTHKLLANAIACLSSSSSLSFLAISSPHATVKIARIKVRKKMFMEKRNKEKRKVETELGTFNGTK